MWGKGAEERKAGEYRWLIMECGRLMEKNEKEKVKNVILEFSLLKDCVRMIMALVMVVFVLLLLFLLLS